VPLRLTLLPAVTSNVRHRAATMSVNRSVDDDGCRTHLRSGWCQGRDIAMVKCTSPVYLQESENPLVARAAMQLDFARGQHDAPIAPSRRARA
jgi:hypothetical protein